MNARFRPEGERRTEFVHTLNGSGLAVGRTLIARARERPAGGRQHHPARGPAALYGRYGASDSRWLSCSRRSRGSKAPRILVTNDDGINAPGATGAGAHRPAAQQRRLGGRARDQSERRLALPDDAPAAAHPQDVEAALRGRRHADRLRAARAADRRSRTALPSSSSPASITAAISARTSPIPAPSPPPWRQPCSTFPPSR